MRRSTTVIHRMISAVVAVALVLTAACTAPQLAYERLDWLASWQLSRYVSLNGDQQQRFDADFDALWIWHRELELARYAQDLRELAEASQQPLTAAPIADWARRINAHWDRLITKLAPVACVQLAGLNDAQVASVLRRVDRDIAARRDELVTPPEAEVRKDSERRLLKTLRRWLGDLDQAQRSHVARWSAERELTYADWLDQRQRWRDRFADALASRQSAAFCPQLETLLTRPEAATTGDSLVTRYHANRARGMEFMAQFSATLSEPQRRHLRSELLKLAEDFEALARPG